MLDSEHGSNELLKFTRVDVHRCIGISLHFRIEGSCVFSQFNTIKKFWLSFPEYFRRPRRIPPAPEKIFKEFEYRERLDNDKTKNRHSEIVKVGILA